MIDWTLPTNGTEIVLTAVVQVFVVILTAVMTWAIARASDRRSEDRNREATYRRELERYYDALQDASDVLDTLVQRRDGDGIPTVEGARYHRFVGRTVWHPRQEDLAVDSWIRTEMLWIPQRMATLSAQETWDEYEVYSLRKRLRDLVRDFEKWLEGELPSTDFRDRLQSQNMRSWLPRFGDPLSELPSRLDRLIAAGRTSNAAFRRAWRGP